MPPAKIKLLLVDDKPANLLALEAVLDSPAYELVRAGSGFQALEQVERTDFAAILLDVQMPLMDGYETARRIKKLPKGKDVPIIFVTAVFREDEDARRGYQAGGLDFFPKPIDPDLLRTKIKLYGDLFLMSHLAREGSVAAIMRERQLAERKLETILRSITEGVVVSDRDGKIVQINQEGLRLFGSVEAVPFDRRHEYVGTHPETGDCVPSDDWPLVRALERGEVCPSELTEVEVPGGAKMLLLNSATPLKTEEGELVGAVCVFKEMPPNLSWGPPPAGPPARPGASA